MEILSNSSYIRAGGVMNFHARGGVAPYVYSVISGYAEGTIDSSSGVYAAPSYIPDDPRNTVETIIATDFNGLTAKIEISILTIEELVADIMRTEMGLEGDQVFLYNQKWTLPNDDRLYLTVSLTGGKPIGNNRAYDPSGAGLAEVQSVVMKETISIDLHSSTPEALKRKEEVIMAITSTYSQSQQELNSFSIAKIPSDMNNLSNVESSIIPYRFSFSFVIQYSKSKIKDVPYFDIFSAPNIIVDN